MVLQWLEFLQNQFFKNGEILSIDFIKIKAVFEKTFELNDFKLSLESRFEEVPGWDSLGHMQLISCLEDEFDIELGIEEIIGVDTVQKIQELVNTKLND